MVTQQFKARAKLSLRKTFELFQRLGFDILPHHFYSDIPTIKELRLDQRWREPYTMVDVHGTDVTKQLEFVSDCCTPALIDLQRQARIWENACCRNGIEGFGKVEADFLYCFIRSKRPKHIIQVGCGVSTAIIQKAATDEGYVPHFECVEPFPTSYLRQEHAAGRIQLIEKKAQDVDYSTFAILGRNDFLFVDSTHTLQPGGEVPRTMLEVLPRLGRGTWVHFHDITFPYDYQPGVLTGDLFFPHESVLLHAFLAGNPNFCVRASLSMLHHSQPLALKRYLPNYSPALMSKGLRVSQYGDFPSSIYLQVND